MNILIFLAIIAVSAPCSAYRILAVFPYNGVSHHIYFSSIIKQLASRNHEVTVINYIPMKSNPNIRQISLQQKNDNKTDVINIKEFYDDLPNYNRDLYIVYKSAPVFKQIAVDNCKRIMTNNKIMNIVKTEKFDLVILEQFVSDCGFALSHHLKVPVVGVTAHVLMPWTYSRLGAQNPPSVTPNHFMATGTKLSFWETVKSYIINVYLDVYHTHYTQTEELNIIKEVLPETPDLETLSKNISLILINQYVPLTGSRIFGANVVEVGGLHINQTELNVDDKLDKELKSFLDDARSGVVYISFGTVASDLPQNIIDAVLMVAKKTNVRFVWKINQVKKASRNILIRKWFPQVHVLCHQNVLGFISHSGMLSISEAMHCGVPVISVPLFGDQFANAASARECGLGITLDLEEIDEEILYNAMQTILGQEYQKKASTLASLWNDRQNTPMETAIHWIEYVARHQDVTHLSPVTVNIPKYMLEWIVLFNSTLIGLYITFILMKKPPNYRHVIPATRAKKRT